MPDTPPEVKATGTPTVIPPRPADHRGHTLKYWPADALRDEFAKGRDEIGYLRIAEELAWREKYAEISPEYMTVRDDVEYFDELGFVEGVAELLQDDDTPERIGFQKDYFPNGKAFLAHHSRMLVVIPVHSGSQIRYTQHPGDPVSVLELTRNTALSVVADVARTIAQRFETRPQ